MYRRFILARQLLASRFSPVSFCAAATRRPYIPIIDLVAIVIAMVAIGMTLAPYFILRRGSLSRYFATLASLTPLMIYVSVSNAPSILKTVFGATETWKRTPKTGAIAPTDSISRF